MYKEKTRLEKEIEEVREVIKFLQWKVKKAIRDDRVLCGYHEGVLTFNEEKLKRLLKEV